HLLAAFLAPPMSTCSVVFEVRCPTVNSEELRLVGSLPELGAWNPSHAVRLKTSERTFPVWRTAELAVKRDVSEAVQYKYIKVYNGSLVQWEAGPNRILDLSCLCDSLANYVDDVTFDLNDNVTRRSGVRIRFAAASKSQMTSLGTSRLASTVPSPLRTSCAQTPLEKSPGCMEELESILRELKELEPMNLSSRAEIRRALIAVRAAIEVEQAGGRFRYQRRLRPITCAMVSLFLVPILPMMVASGIIMNVPSARTRYDDLLATTRESCHRLIHRPSSDLTSTKRERAGQRDRGPRWKASSSGSR
ncbi:unnamed protein product, partial [Polarella glacialis]